MNPVQTPYNIVNALDKVVTPRSLPSFDGYPWEVSVGASAIAVTKGQPTAPLDPRVTDRADYYLWCGANICVHQPPEKYRGHVTNYFASITPNVQGAFRHPPVNGLGDRWLELVRWAPTTTQGATSYSSGMSESINGSIGFFGDTPTGSIGGGVTWSNNQTRSSPDVDIAAYTRSNSATFMFNLNQPSTIAATSSMELYVQALFRLEGFSPEYLAYLDYTQGKPSKASDAIDPTTGLPPLTPHSLATWAAATPQQKENLLKIRALQYGAAIKLGFEIDFQAITDSNILPMAPVTITCGTPSVDITNDGWQAFLGKPPKTTLQVSDAVGDNSTIIGYLISGDPNYQPSENPNQLSESQTLRSWNGEYVLNIDTNGHLNISPTTGKASVWNDSVTVSAAGVTFPHVTTNLGPARTVVRTVEKDVAAPPTQPGPAVPPPVASPVASPYRLQFNGTFYSVSNGSQTRDVVFQNQPAPTGNVIKPGQPDKYGYRRLELTGDGTLRVVDSSGTMLWASSYAPLSSSSTSSIESQIFSSLGGAVNGLEAVGSGILKFDSSVLGIGGLLPSLGGAIPGGVSGIAGTVASGAKGVAGTIAGGVSGVAGTIAGGVSGAAGSVASGVSGAAGSVASGVSGAAGAVEHGLGGAVGTIGGALGGLGHLF